MPGTCRNTPGLVVSWQPFAAELLLVVHVGERLTAAVFDDEAGRSLLDSTKAAGSGATSKYHR
jgi:hypothetical protein